MKIVIAAIVAMMIGGCASSRQASLVREPNQAPKAGDPYSRTIYIQKSNESTFIPPKAVPSAPRRSSVPPPPPPPPLFPNASRSDQPKVGGSTMVPRTVNPSLPFPSWRVPSDNHNHQDGQCKTPT